MPLTFYIIISVQAITLILWSIFTKKKITIPELLVSGLVGILLGIPFDIILGNLQIYTYITQLNTSKVLLTGLSMTQLVVNGFLSFGIVVATAKLFTSPSVPVQEKIQKILLVIYSITLITSLLLIQALPNGTISLMFACGICVVIFGELLLMLRKKSGPVSQLLITRKLQPFLLLIA